MLSMLKLGGLDVHVHPLKLSEPTQTLPSTNTTKLYIPYHNTCQFRRTEIDLPGHELFGNPNSYP